MTSIGFRTCSGAVLTHIAAGNLLYSGDISTYFNNSSYNINKGLIKYIHFHTFPGKRDSKYYANNKRLLVVNSVYDECMGNPKVQMLELSHRNRQNLYHVQ